MLVTDLAYRDMNARSGGLAFRLKQVGRWLLRRPPVCERAASQPYLPTVEHQVHLRLVAGPERATEGDGQDETGTGDAFRWRRHPQLLGQSDPSMAADEADLERSARSAAVRGLFLARSGRIEEAREAFAIGAAAPSVDLTAIPGFWDLSRSGMQAAVGAYDDVERYREASALGARIRLKYRPRSVRVVPTPSSSRQSASGS